MELSIRIDGIEKKFEFEKRGEVYHFLIEGKTYLVSAEPLSNGAFTFFIGNRSYVAYPAEVEGGTRIAIGGSSFFVEGEEESGDLHGGVGASAHADGKVESPMPGNIISINVSEGDAVEADQAVVVIESMKMQNEITSPVNGEVKKVNCAVGDQVNFGDILVEITPKG